MPSTTPPICPQDERSSKAIALCVEHSAKEFLIARMLRFIGSEYVSLVVVVSLLLQSCAFRPVQDSADKLCATEIMVRDRKDIKEHTSEPGEREGSKLQTLEVASSRQASNALMDTSADFESAYREIGRACRVWALCHLEAAKAGRPDDACNQAEDVFEQRRQTARAKRERMEALACIARRETNCRLSEKLETTKDVAKTVAGVHSRQDKGQAAPRSDSQDQITLVTQKGHTLPVTVAAISPDGSILATGGQDATIVLWDFASGNIITVLKGSIIGVFSLVFSPDGQYLASGDLDSVKIWAVRSGTLIRSIQRLTVVTSLAFSPDGRTLVADGGLYGQIILVNTTTWRQTKSMIMPNRKRLLKKDNDGLNLVTFAFSPDGKSLVVADHDAITGYQVALSTLQHIAIFTLEEKEVGALICPNDECVPGAAFTAIAFSHDGRLLAIGTEDSRMFLWDVKTQKRRTLLHANHGAIDKIAFSRDDNMIVAANHNGTGTLWRAQEATVYRTLGKVQVVSKAERLRNLNSVAFSP